MCSVSFWPAISLAQGQQAPAAPVSPPPAPAAQNAKPLPDYPDPRTFMIGASYWLTGPGKTLDVDTGSQALDFETLHDLGKAKYSPAIEASYPITRTGSLHFEIFQTQGDGNQLAPIYTDIFSQGISQGDSLSTQYKIIATKLYLDDLLFPHKFPVAKFRLKSLWEVQYVHAKATIDDLTEGAEATTPITTSGTKQFILPTFGLAAEYAIAPHVLLRIDGSGFGIPHKADIWDAGASVAYRHGLWETVAGGKAFHFKSSPNSTEYLTDTLAGAFIGIRFHLSLF